MARTSIRPARFTQAISNTTATAIKSARKSGRVCATVFSASGRTDELMCSAAIMGG